jgi:hypothetical protein
VIDIIDFKTTCPLPNPARDFGFFYVRKLYSQLAYRMLIFLLGSPFVCGIMYRGTLKSST